MDCIWTKLRKNEYTCIVCRRPHLSKYEPDLIHRNCIIEVTSNKGPGTRLSFFLGLFKLKPEKGCSCNNWIDWMNTIGGRGSWTNREIIIQKLLSRTNNSIIKIILRSFLTILLWTITRKD